MRLRFLVVALMLVGIAAPAPTADAVPLQEPEAQEAHAADGAQEHAGEEVEHGAEAEHHGPTWGEYAMRWINFVMLAALLWWLLVVPPAFVVDNFEFPGLKVVLGERAGGIVAARELAREQRQEAERRLAESQERLDRVEQEARELVAEAEGDAERERQRLEREAEEQADRIRQTADRDLRSETLQARRQLRAHAANLAVEMAADLVRDNLTEEDQRRLVREYLEDLGERVA